MISDKELIYRCRKQDKEAQRLLFEKYKGKLLGICLRYAKSKTEAEDVLQDSFIKIFQSFNQNDEREIKSLSAWLSRITINTSIDQYYKNKKHNNDSIDNLAFHAEIADTETALENMQANDLIRLIQSMPDRFRVIFNLYIIEGYNHAEIAERLNIAESASRSHLTRAKAWLRERIKKNEVIV
ncbi:MAG TPA: RNA polymerase sigma factor [Cyclobacteriaceae bacterium]|nr:RNA polymerase sigma factor [Cyclobacteriaceae bacterium]